MAIIAILAAVLLPVLSQAKAIALRAKCLSNLKQIGSSIQMYADDNDDKLPGPLWLGQPFQYDETTIHSLPLYLADYLATPKASARMAQTDVFLCPAYERSAPVASPGVERVSLIANRDIDPASGPDVSPFGYPARAGDPMRNSMKLSEISQFAPTSDAWAVADADRKNSPVNDNPWRAQLPVKPAHGNSRNQLYFDWHASSERIR